MDNFTTKLNYQKPDPLNRECYDIEEVKLSIQETAEAIEKIFFEGTSEVYNKF